MPAPPRARAALALAPALALAGLAAIPAGASGTTEIALAQATGTGDPPRPTVGVGSPAGATLSFHVALTHHCPAGPAGTQLFVAIADTARLVEPGPPGVPQPVTVDVPLRQLQWLAQPAAACRTVGAQRRPDETGGDGLRYFRLHAGTAGYATVTCRDDSGGTSSATTSAPLDVWLSCPADAGPGG